MPIEGNLSLVVLGVSLCHGLGQMIIIRVFGWAFDYEYVVILFIEVLRLDRFIAYQRSSNG